MIFNNWTPEHADKFGKEPILLAHTLHQNPLLSEDSLAQIIDVYKQRDHRHLLAHMGPVGSPKESWKQFRIGKMTGRQLIERIRHERLWISLHDTNHVSADFQRLLDSVFGEMHDNVPGCPPTFQRTCAVLISSPGAQVFYHFDISGQTLWQIQGTKTVRLYPCREPFLTQERIDMVSAFRESFHDESTQPWRPEFDRHAIDFRGDGDLTLYPGEMVYWPLNMPHRIENGDQMSISFTTEFYTKEIKRHMRASVANGVLRTFGRTPAVTESGPRYYAKLRITAVAKGTGLVPKAATKACGAEDARRNIRD